VWVPGCAPDVTGAVYPIMTATLLVVEDDHDTRTFLADNLTADGYDLVVAGSLREGLRSLAGAPDLALVDVGLPDGSGLELVARARAARDGLDPGQRFLVVSGQVAEHERVRSLRVGADDYLAKPFSYAELLLRVKALLRRGSITAARPPVLRAGPLTVDVATRAVTLRGERIELSAKEFELLQALAADPERVHTKAELLRDVWGYTVPATTRTLDSHACRLRRKLGTDYVRNVWGVGYRLCDEVVAP
jgi:DNA-binding response OmpR family regulator